MHRIGASKRMAVDWRLNPSLLLRLDFTHFTHGAFAGASGLASSTYAVATVDVRF
ncbi:hypothetical protein [Frateuria defendens]|uniref:hypothetical protein n=1 Tax=Frateuria defendens TaxID=2219559 RepID=UPI001292FAF2|nr:hypothetical protein [Frateuria defendens]